MRYRRLTLVYERFHLDLIENLLKSEGIAFWTKNKEVQALFGANYGGPLNSALGAYEVYVEEKHWNKALNLLYQWLEVAHDAPKQCPACYTPLKTNDFDCPNCGLAIR